MVGFAMNWGMTASCSRARGRRRQSNTEQCRRPFAFSFWRQAVRCMLSVKFLQNSIKATQFAGLSVRVDSVRSRGGGLLHVAKPQDQAPRGELSCFLGMSSLLEAHLGWLSRFCPLGLGRREKLNCSDVKWKWRRAQRCQGGMCPSLAQVAKGQESVLQPRKYRHKLCLVFMNACIHAHTCTCEPVST